MTPSAAALRNPVGSHVRVGRGLVEGALATAEEIGAEAIQVFAGNPRGWAHSSGDAARDTAFREACAARGIRVWVHAPYLVNLGSPTATTYERSVASVAHNLVRAAAIGAEGVVVHTGSCVDEGSLEQAMRQVHEGLLPLLDRLEEDAPWLLLEPTAGQGRSLCAGVEDLGAYLEALDRHPRVGVCLDTCHVFAAGAPLDEPGGTTATLDRLVEVAGPGRLRLVHANDSLDVRGSARDRHERIGDGQIGTGAFTEVFTHPATTGVPLVLETRGSGEPGGPCLPLLRKLREAAARR
ncbi:MAG TPA: deoxyribonuclease IV [Marmoricola sp.]|nr:deoxyribonuclease IV [Marmoricola sp.]